MSGDSEILPAAGVVRDAIDLRRLPWIRPLVTAYLDDFGSVAPLFAGNPKEPAAWRSAIRRVTNAPRQRAALATVLTRQLEQRGAPDEARAAAASLADDSTVAVVSGQQAGLFGGPLYTLLKAVTAVQLARRVRTEHGTSAVAVFWVDAEDHDWNEIRTASILDEELSLRHVTVDQVEGAGTRPVASLAFDAGINDALDELDAGLAASEFKSETMSALRRHFRPGAGVATAFAGFLDDLLGRHGLIVFESGDAHVKPLVADLFVHELEHPGRTGQLAREAGEAMAKLGHQPQVQPAADSVALFHTDASGRRPIKRRDPDFVVGDQTRPAADLLAEVRAHPERFSPNVLLRPLVQDRLFPTVCYVAGPSELAYQAQLGNVYREFGVEAPLLYPRATATLVDSGAARFLEKSRTPFESLQARDESALNRLLESLLPPSLERTFEETDRQIAEGASRLKTAVVSLDPTLSGAVDTTLDRMREALKTLQGKIIQATKRKDETLRRQFTRTRALAFPDGHPQERILCSVFFVNRYGLLLTDRLIESLPLETDKHYILRID
ncbi:MAG TPA: bacillithiol biosynthesis cysteine-adding enzyme BshC [Vicinamibacterales bacterium]|nr:bacillithiol biosynthesis cysteine-adding enzyme BshC [Vicinamibacterales bacterium]